jgi:hypothetical protein
VFLYCKYSDFSEFLKQKKVVLGTCQPRNPATAPPSGEGGGGVGAGGGGGAAGLAAGLGIGQAGRGGGGGGMGGGGGASAEKEGQNKFCLNIGGPHAVWDSSEGGCRYI